MNNSSRNSVNLLEGETGILICKKMKKRMRTELELLNPPLNHVGRRNRSVMSADVRNVMSVMLEDMGNGMRSSMRQRVTRSRPIALLLSGMFTWVESISN
ncbi:hypothetical protein D3C78_1670040 [compost metagenome]